MQDSSNPVGSMDESEDQLKRKRAALLLWSLETWNKKSSSANQHASLMRKKSRRMASMKKSQKDRNGLFCGEWNEQKTETFDEDPDQIHEESCGAILIQITEANTESESCCDFLQKICDVFESTCLPKVCLAVLSVFLLGMVSLGVKFLDHCPVQPKIPVYLMVGGCLGLIKLVSLVWYQVRRAKRLDEVASVGDDSSADFIVSKSTRFSEMVISAILFAWFVCGNYWVLGVWRPNFVQVLHDPRNWCDRTVYMFAFVQIMVCHGLTALVLLAIVALGVYYFAACDRNS